MDRVASNTLRILGIIFTAIIVLAGSLLFLLLSMCAFQGGFEGGKHPDQGYGYIAATIILDAVGITIIVLLARSFRSFKSEPNLYAIPGQPSTGQPASTLNVPFDSTTVTSSHLSPQSRAAIWRVVFVIIAQLLVSTFSWLYAESRMLQAVRPHALHPIILLIPFLLSHLPALLLIYALLKSPSRTAFAYSLTIPAVSIFFSLYYLGISAPYLMRSPMTLAPSVLILVLDIAMIILAYQAIQQVGLHPEASSLVVSAVVMVIFFLFMTAIRMFFYRFALQ